MIFKRYSPSSHSKSFVRLWVMHVFVLMLPKGITHKPFDLFEFRQLEDLLKIVCYRWCDIDSRKFNNSGDWLGFVGLGVIYPKWDKLCNLPCFYNLACSQTSPTVKHYIEKVFPLISLKKLGSFLSYGCFRFKASEWDNSIGTPFRNHVLPLVWFWVKKSSIIVGVGLVSMV